MKSARKGYIINSLSAKDYAGDSTGQVAMNAINAMSGQMTYFYTNKVGMNPIVAGNILLISKIADGISDIVMGRLVDKTNTKDGKARPWLKWMIIPTLLAMILLFTVPKGRSGAGIGIVGTIIRIIAPANITVFILGNCLVTFATAPIVAVLPAMVINCAEWLVKDISSENGFRVICLF
ncbi:hypothetical protein DW928_02900 [Firmicutes bacterium AM43-11BH]|nr:hypothetical protein DW928_02900 [Firmicutes bacterium AM43-11BH]